jgi:hypothetical protein
MILALDTFIFERMCTSFKMIQKQQGIVDCEVKWNCQIIDKELRRNWKIMEENFNKIYELFHNSQTPIALSIAHSTWQYLFTHSKLHDLGELEQDYIYN